MAEDAFLFDPESDPEADEPEEEPIRFIDYFRIHQDVSEWCTCGHCQKMPSEPENVCCQEVQQVRSRLQDLDAEEDRASCITNHPGMQSFCLNVFNLQQILKMYIADYGPLKISVAQQRHRFLAYRAFVSWCWGYLGRQVRVPIPACTVLRIRREFP